MQHFKQYSSTDPEDVKFLFGSRNRAAYKRSLLETLRGIRQLQSEDLRDRVFGTLATTDWKSRTPIQPDYDKDRFDLAIEVLQAIKAQDQFRDSPLPVTTEVAKLLGQTTIKPTSR
jgi:hypothetical protein